MSQQEESVMSQVTKQMLVRFLDQVPTEEQKQQRHVMGQVISSMGDARIKALEEASVQARRDHIDFIAEVTKLDDTVVDAATKKQIIKDSQDSLMVTQNALNSRKSITRY